MFSFKKHLTNNGYPCLNFTPDEKVIYLPHEDATVDGKTTVLSLYSHVVEKTNSCYQTVFYKTRDVTYDDLSPKYLAGKRLLILSPQPNCAYGENRGHITQSLEEIRRDTDGILAIITTTTMPPLPAAAHGDPGCIINEKFVWISWNRTPKIKMAFSIYPDETTPKYALDITGFVNEAPKFGISLAKVFESIFPSNGYKLDIFINTDTDRCEELLLALAEYSVKHCNPMTIHAGPNAKVEKRIIGNMVVI